MALSDRRLTAPVIAQVTTVVGGINTTATAVELPHIPNGVIFLIQLTAAATDVGDTLNLTIETLCGDLWVPVYQATEFLGNGGAKTESSDKIVAGAAEGHDQSFGAAQSANAHINVIGRKWRVAYIQVDADNDAIFTFTVTAIIM